MKKLTTFLKRNRCVKNTMLLFLSVVFLACESEKFQEPDAESADLSVNSFNFVKVTSSGMNFDMPETIPAGWNTFRYENKTENTHFFLIQDLPEGISLENSKTEVVPFFQAGMDFWRQGDAGKAFGPEGFGGLPGWYSNVVMMGGTGLVSAGYSATASMYLEPGTYVAECYVKGPDGKFHSFHGMIDQFIVTDEEIKDTEAPRVDASIEIGASKGIVFTEEPDRPGKYTFSVHYLDQALYGNLLGHDVHLVRLADFITQEDLEYLNKWMNWFYVGEDLEGLTEPAPEGFTFLGGLQEMPAGHTGYFTAVLTPGKYVLISEIDNPMALNPDDQDRTRMYTEFEIR